MNTNDGNGEFDGENLPEMAAIGKGGLMGRLKGRIKEVEMLKRMGRISYVMVSGLKRMNLKEWMMRVHEGARQSALRWGW